MRSLITIFLFAISGATFGNGAQFAGDVFSYECKNATPEKDGFTCRIESDANSYPRTRIYINLTKNPKKLSKDKNEYYNYKFKSFIIRYFDLGGRLFYLTADFWDNGTIKHCMHSTKSKHKYSHHCENVKS